MIINSDEVAIIKIDALNEMVENLILSLNQDLDDMLEYYDFEYNGDVLDTDPYMFYPNVFKQYFEQLKKRDRNYLIGQADVIMDIIVEFNNSGINTDSKRFTIDKELFKFVSYLSKLDAE